MTNEKNGDTQNSLSRHLRDSVIREKAWGTREIARQMEN